MAFKQVILDGIDVTRDTIGGEGFSIELSLDATSGTVLFALTSDLILIGDAYQLVYNRFVPNCLSCTDKLVLTIVPDCCDIMLMFELIAEGVVFDPLSCEARINGLQNSGAVRKFKYIDSNNWWMDNAGVRLLSEVQAPKIMYFREPTFWQRITMIFRDFSNSKYHFYHICPLLLDVINWNCDRAGLSFESQSIFTAYPDYSRLALLYAPNREGPQIFNAFSEIEQNYPIETLIQLLESLKEVFNADFRIVDQGTTLRFETLDWWRANSPPIADYNTLVEAGTITSGGTFQADANLNKAYGRFQYSQDQIDTGANRARFFYNDYVSYNPSGLNECLRGELTNIITFGASHIVGDSAYFRLRIDEDIDVMDKINSDNPDSKLYMTTGQASLPKLLIVPPGWKTLGEYITPQMRFDSEGFKETGWQLSFNQEEPEGLFQRFHRNRDPSRTSGMDFSDITYVPDSFCEAVAFIQANGLQVSLSTPFGPALPESVELDFSEKTVTLKGLTVKCDIP